jgi:hypothetical protein
MELRKTENIFPLRSEEKESGLDKYFFKAQEL